MWRAVSWNLNWWNKRERALAPTDLIRRYDADVVMLQEVSGRDLQRSHDGPSVFSQDVHPGANWGWMGCGLLLRPGTEIIESGVVTGLPKPQRSIWARIILPGETVELTVVSWHAPNRAGDGLEVKMAAFEVMAEWLHRAARPVCIGADLNTWDDRVDLEMPDPAEEHFHEHAFVGLGPPHGLIDAYRTVRDRSGQLDELRAQGASAPLAVSHVLSNGAEHRMDRIFASPDLTPTDGGYDLVGAIEAGSDHALHWIDFD